MSDQKQFESAGVFVKKADFVSFGLAKTEPAGAIGFILYHDPKIEMLAGMTLDTEENRNYVVNSLLARCKEKNLTALFGDWPVPLLAYLATGTMAHTLSINDSPGFSNVETIPCFGGYFHPKTNKYEWFLVGYLSDHN